MNPEKESKEESCAEEELENGTDEEHEEPCC
jgi:hypothetical protein